MACSSLTCRPSPFAHRSWSLNPTSNGNRPILLSLKPRSFNHSRLARAAQHGPGVVSPDNVAVEVEAPAVETQEDKEGVGGSLDGVAETHLGDDTKDATASSTRAKKKREDDDSFEDRFKVRNGREVCFFSVLFFFNFFFSILLGIELFAPPFGGLRMVESALVMNGWT